MKQSKTEEQNKELKSWTSSGNSLSPEEFLSGIKEAEQGTFHTVQESMENFEQWMKTREKK
ncbi:MAG: hypothetical protein ACM3PR_03200 [Bacteroidales bacterium]